MLCRRGLSGTLCATRGSFAHAIARPLYRFTNRLRMPPRDRRNFVERKSFDAIQAEMLRGQCDPRPPAHPAPARSSRPNTRSAPDRALGGRQSRSPASILHRPDGTEARPRRTRSHILLPPAVFQMHRRFQFLQAAPVISRIASSARRTTMAPAPFSPGGRWSPSARATTSLTTSDVVSHPSAVLLRTGGNRVRDRRSAPAGPGWHSRKNRYHRPKLSALARTPLSAQTARPVRAFGSSPRANAASDGWIAAVPCGG